MSKIAPSKDSIKRFKRLTDEYLRNIDDCGIEETFASIASYVAARLLIPIKSDEFELITQQCESPIEEMLCASMLILARIHCESIDLAPTKIETYPPKSCVELVIEPQFKIEKYRIDFRVTIKEYDRKYENGFFLCHVFVECDGHNFHERTKEQAKRDRSRDRYIQSLGFPVLRFTGSEIYDDPIKCAEEVFRQLYVMRGARV